MEATARNVDAARPEIVFEDGLGLRYLVTGPSGAVSAEVLAFRPSLATARSFEFALRERVARLGSFSHPAFTHLRGVERTGGVEPGLRMVSDAVVGTRLSTLIDSAEALGVYLDTNAALCITRQLVGAIAALHERARDLAHGAISAERLVVTPEGRVIVVEHGTGAALQQLRFTRKQYWSELRVALPVFDGPLLFDQRVDVIQIGVVALGLILGRPLKDIELPNRFSDLVGTARAVSARGDVEPLPSGLRGWLGRALQLDPLRSFASALDARDDLDLILGDTDDFASLTSLEGFLERVEQRMPFPGMEQDREPQVEIEPDRRRDVVLADIDAALELPQVEAPALHRIDAATVLPFGPQTGAEASTDRTVTTAPEPVAPVEDLVEQTPAASSEAQYYRAPETTNAPPARNQTARTMTAGLVAAVVAAIAGYAAASRGPLTASKVLAPGAVELSTGPAGIDAFIDGTFRGLTPLTITLAPGLHTIDLGRPQSKPQSIPVSIHAGMKISQFVELPLAAEFGEEAELRMADVSKRAVDSGRLVDRGSVTVVSEATLRIVEGDAVIGSSRDRLELPVGRHELTLVDEASGINTTRVVQVDVKKPAVLKVAVPMGVLAVSTTPGAEVWVDGNKRGETPIGSLALRAGAHDIVFRHPDFGDRRRAVVVTAGDLLQLSVDLRAR